MDVKPFLIIFINQLLTYIDLMRYTDKIKKEAIVTFDRIEEITQLIFKAYLTIHWRSLKLLKTIKQNKVNYEYLFERFGDFVDFINGFGVTIDVDTKHKKIEMILDIKYKNDDVLKHYDFLAKELSERSDAEITQLLITNPAMLELYQSQEFLNEIEKHKKTR